MEETASHNRQTVLNELINFEKELVYLQDTLSTFDWDSEQELVVLDFTHLENVLNRYLSEQISQDAVNEWANLIEMRDDIGFAPHNENSLKELIFELANPEITSELTKDRALELLQVMK